MPIDIVIVEPGFFATELETGAPEPEQPISDYDATRASVTASIEESLREGDDPAVVAEKIAAIIAEVSPKLRYRVGDDARLVPLLKNLMPRSVFEIGLLHRFGLNE